MMTPVPALVLTLAFLCQGWGKHFLLDTKDSNLTDLQYNEDYLSTCRSGCTQNYHCPRQCPYCRRGDEEYRRLKVTDWEGKKRKKRAVNGLKALCELRIGDLIRTSSGDHHTDFTEFLGWLDRQRSSPAEMLQIFTSDNYPAVTLSR